jgi:DNA-binding PadR family transcriptional regulator
MPTRPMTHAEQAVLSLVAEAPRHGYEIEQVIQSREMRDWADLGFSSIYYLLARLERRGLVRSARSASPEGPARRVYRCTPAGVAALRDAVRRALTHPQPGDSPVQLALANLPVLSTAETRRALQRYRELLGQRLDHLRQSRAAQGDLPVHVRAMFTRSAALLRAEIRWADGFLSRPERARQGTHRRYPRRIP